MHIANRDHLPWCDRTEHMASGQLGCLVKLTEAEGIEVWMYDTGYPEPAISLRGAQGKPMWHWPAPILARVIEALTEANAKRDKLLGK